MDHIEKRSGQEDDVKVTLGSYFKYIFYSRANWLLFPFTVLLFLESEVINTIYFLLLANYSAEVGPDLDRKNFADMNTFWLILGVLQVVYMAVLVVKYFLLTLVCLQSNQHLHHTMLYGMVRSPASYFDVTPSGQLISRFSNDMGILDNSLTHVLTDAI